MPKTRVDEPGDVPVPEAGEDDVQLPDEEDIELAFREILRAWEKEYYNCIRDDTLPGWSRQCRQHPIVLPVDYDLLAARPQSDEHRTHAQSVYDNMLNPKHPDYVPVDKTIRTSGFYVNSKGRPLISYFATRTLGKPVAEAAEDQDKTGKKGKKKQKFTIFAPKFPPDVPSDLARGRTRDVWDGIPRDYQNYIQAVTQTYLHYVSPKLPTDEMRHNGCSEQPWIWWRVLDEEDVCVNLPPKINHDKKKNERPHKLRVPLRPDQTVEPLTEAQQRMLDAEYSRSDTAHQIPMRTFVGYDGKTPVFRYEKAGVAHMVHSWYAKGRNATNDFMLPSALMLGNGGAARATITEWYMDSTSFLHKLLGEYIKLTDRPYWKKIHKTYHAGRWVTSDYRHGAFLGRAIVWKLQIEVHRDSQDEAGAYCRTGIVFPDLGLIFEYPPGSIIIFRSADLYHGIIPWEPAPQLPNHGSLSSGRYSYVFFNQGRAVQALEGKPQAWGRKTAYGRLESKGLKKTSNTEESEESEDKREIESEDESECGDDVMRAIESALLS
ncbi:hypothetical protein SISSUDRAFT_1067295 [Sistotremastrum suecicum HHB10207 ss-3]|uniref:Uncharacterized protein n=1 Tax=Sistotremastrum suecicum HHB10207 ss-3 TaxID=1314776 RepID=A0A165X9Y3_9AGAM|nr:hypothetical protein SISSUDRAFT_1067295 [Sistotremastrum suecicum HHB10207 ss-3]